MGDYNKFFVVELPVGEGFEYSVVVAENYDEEKDKREGIVRKVVAYCPTYQNACDMVEVFSYTTNKKERLRYYLSKFVKCFSNQEQVDRILRDAELNLS